MIRFKIVLLLVISLLSSKLMAQSGWSLNTCILYALQNNLGIHSTELDEKSATLDARQSIFNLFPKLSASVSSNYNVGRSVDLSTNSYVDQPNFSGSSSIYASVTLFNGFLLHNNIAYRRHLKTVAQLRTTHSEDLLAFNVMESYHLVLYYSGLVAIVKSQLKVSEYALKKTTIQIETGVKAQTDLAEMEAAFAKEELTLIQAENNLEAQKLHLAQLMNLPDYAFSSLKCDTVSVILKPLLSPDIDSIYDGYEPLSPTIKMAESLLSAVKKERQMAMAQYFPSLSLNAAISSQYSDTYLDNLKQTVAFRNQLDYYQNKYVGITLSIPIFNRNQLRTNVRKIDNNYDKYALSLEIATQAERYKLQNDMRQMHGLYREYQQTEKKVEADEVAFHVAQRKYEEGIIDVIEFLTVKNRLINSKSDLLMVGLKWQVKDRSLQFYKGVRFWEL